MNGTSLTYSELRWGIPQGSILGPLLFIIYTYDIFSEIETDERIYMYADDTLLLNSGETENIAVQNAQNCLNKIIKWCKLNKLTLNENKTQHMCVIHRNHSTSLKINADGMNLGNVDTYDYLGFCMDKKLNMHSHIEKIVKKISFKIYILTLMRRFLTLKTSLLVYKVMIMPHFDYVDFVIDSSNKDCTDRLERLHKRAIRKIEYKFDCENKTAFDILLKTYNLTTLYRRRAEQLLFFMYKKRKLDKDMLQLQRHKMELRSKNKVQFKHIFTDKTKVQNSPILRGIFLWNQLPANVQNMEILPHFKSAI